MTPLSHHEIVTLVAPFAGLGRHVDLKASNRLERRLVFKSIDHPAASSVVGPLTEELVLESPEEGAFQLTRTLTSSEGLAASLSASGPDPGALLQRIERVPLSRHFTRTPDFTIAFSYRLAPGMAGTDDSRARVQPLLTKASATLEMVNVGFDFSPLNDRRVPLEIRPKEDAVSALPSDFLTLLGSPWDRIERDTKGWRGRLYVPKAEPARTAFGERNVTEMVIHLVNALEASPTEFHHRYLKQRRRVLMRGVLTMLGVLAAMAVSPLILVVAPDQPLLTTLASFWFPAVVFSLPFIASRVAFITPSWPRPLPATAWRPSSPETADDPGASRANPDDDVSPRP
jgi:hypothetical protein